MVALLAYMYHNLFQVQVELDNISSQYITRLISQALIVGLCAKGSDTPAGTVRKSCGGRIIALLRYSASSDAGALRHAAGRWMGRS